MGIWFEIFIRLMKKVQFSSPKRRLNCQNCMQDGFNSETSQQKSLKQRAKLPQKEAENPEKGCLPMPFPLTPWPYSFFQRHSVKKLIQPLESSGGGFSQTKRHNLTLHAWNNICTVKSIGGLSLKTMEFLIRLSLQSWAGR
jgi:hypothetical protein